MRIEQYLLLAFEFFHIIVVPFATVSNPTSSRVFVSKFSAWSPSKLDAQHKMFLTRGHDDDFRDLTVEQQKELCLTIPCRVELFHSNICVGVERNWPKKMFGQKDFQSLRPDQKQQIHDKMVRHAVFLYNKNVDEHALSKRLQKQTNIAFAPYLGLNYRKNRFQRMKSTTGIHTNVKPTGVYWKKESLNDGHSVYADPFADIEIDSVRLWQVQLNALASSKAVESSQKCNTQAHQWIQRGNTAYSDRKWDEAFSAYNQALCFAEPGTTCKGLAYGNRARCFYQLKLYRNGFTDFRLAAQKKCPDKFLNDTRNLRAHCKKQAAHQHKVKRIVPKMTFPANTQFPCMANVLDIKNIRGYGRSVIANANIAVGETIFLAETFASVTMPHNQAYCYTCHRNDHMNFIPCPNCSDVMFCDENCAANNGIHEMECQTPYHRIYDIELKFIIHTVLVAIEIFPSVDDLMEFVVSCIMDRDYNEIPESANDASSKYGIFLKLLLSHDEQDVYLAYQAYTYILLIPKIKRLFDTELKQRFLMQLIVHHAFAIPKNVFNNNDPRTEYIFDVLSIVNHSCAPNVELTTEGKLCYGVTVRPIKKGEQVFISYLSVDSNISTQQRQQMINAAWDFHCKCVKCESK